MMNRIPELGEWVKCLNPSTYYCRIRAWLALYDQLNREWIEEKPKGNEAPSRPKERGIGGDVHDGTQG